MVRISIFITLNHPCLCLCTVNLAAQTPVVEASAETVSEGQPVRLQCQFPGKPDVQLNWRREDGNSLPSSAVEQRGTLTIIRTELSDSGIYICSAGESDDEKAVDSPPIRLSVKSSTRTLADY